MGLSYLRAMARGTPSQGGRRTKSHGLSRINGKQTFHRQKSRCSSSGLGNGGGKMRRYNWSVKAKRRNAPGTGRQQYTRIVQRRATTVSALAAPPRRPETEKAEK